MSTNSSPQPAKLWWYVAPLVAMIVVVLFAPSPPDVNFSDPSSKSLYGQRHTIFVTCQAIVMLAAIGMAWKFVVKNHPPVIGWSGIAVGVIGAFLWVAVCQLQWESKLISLCNLEYFLPPRTGFNPFENIDSKSWMTFFLGARFLVLSLAVPVAEEWALRGWFVRWWESPENWWNVPLEKISFRGLVLIIAYAILTHPHEAIAAFVWFSLVNWLMKRTGNLWECVAAHMVTNFLLGIFILVTEQWQLW